ncbi:hypothetical protein E1212_19385 [Jiangella ureilytica]|uniref:Zf-HC2 domain-containing protein n=1 Tax=Jiangella ureilytica TaxID=2530374 RepID=A0A4R4RK92_9ACTN|nr:hypothetical protein [Jiangella ureilytica]TDC49022.1 hypothetical protein E1212_19385 [Jiangella ureilytica]
MSGTEAHPPTHVLAELAEGVLDGAQAREARAHVDQCLTCQAAIDELAQVTVALGALPAELPVPEFVAARISHALAAERSSGGAATAASAAAGASGSEGGTVAWFRRRLPQGLAAAASVAVVGLAGYVVVSGGTGGGDDSGSAGDSAEVAAGSALSDEPTSVGPLRGAPDPTVTAGDGHDDDVPTYSGGDDFATPPGVDEAELQAAVASIVSERPTGGPGCGEELSEELGQPVVGAETFEAGVLIVLEGADTYDGWLLDTCHSYSTATLEPQVQVPKAE